MGIKHKNIEYNAAYLNGWLAKLKNDKRFMVQATGQAQRAVDFIINQPAPASAETEEAPKSVTENQR